MKIAGSALWLSESDGGVVALPFAGPQCAASPASSSQRSRFVLTMFDSWPVIANATVADGGARQTAARVLRQPSPRKDTDTFGVVARGNSATSGCRTRRIDRAEAAALHNNSLEPTPVTEARFVWSSSGAAQLKR